VEGNPSYHTQTSVGANAATMNNSKANTKTNYDSSNPQSYFSSLTPTSSKGVSNYPVDVPPDVRIKEGGSVVKNPDGPYGPILCPPVDDPTVPFVLRRYDYFKTHVVYGSSTPILNRSFQFNVPHYKYRMRLPLMDGIKDKIIGETHFSIYSIMQRDADHYFDHEIMSNNEEDFPLSSDPNLAASSANCTHRRIHDQSYVGFVRASVSFVQDMDTLFTNSEPMCTPPPPQESFSIERMGVHIARFQAVIAMFGSIQS